MATEIFVNLPVKDLNRSKDFFGKLGFQFNGRFTNEERGFMIVSDTIFVMLLVESYFKTFTNKEIANAAKITEVTLCITAESRESVDE